MESHPMLQRILLAVQVLFAFCPFLHKKLQLSVVENLTMNRRHGLLAVSYIAKKQESVAYKFLNEFHIETAGVEDLLLDKQTTQMGFLNDTSFDQLLWQFYQILWIILNPKIAMQK